MSIIVVSTVHEHDMQCVVSRGGLGLSHTLPVNMQMVKSYGEVVCVLLNQLCLILGVYDSCPAHQDVYVWYMYVAWCLHACPEPQVHP